jgi:hypothetical protein
MPSMTHEAVGRKPRLFKDICPCFRTWLGYNNYQDAPTAAVVRIKRPFGFEVVDYFQPNKGKKE